MIFVDAAKYFCLVKNCLVIFDCKNEGNCYFKEIEICRLNREVILTVCREFKEFGEIFEKFDEFFIKLII